MTKVPHGPAHPAAEVCLPARLIVRCGACGRTRTTVALHDNALVRAQRCDGCGEHAEVIASLSLAGCSCCG